MSAVGKLHIAHLVFRLDYGGLENGLVNLINRLPRNAYRHSVIALTEATDFASRIEPPDTEVIALGKRPGQDPVAYARLFQTLRRLRPQVVHTRNVGTLDSQAIALAAGVRGRVHGEHGWDVGDPDGTSFKGRTVRRLLSPLVQNWIALSCEIESWLVDRIGIPREKVERICNGVDVDRFQPAPSSGSPSVLRFGTITRFSEIKDPLNTLEAFIRLAGVVGADQLQLTFVGDGPLRSDVEARARDAGMVDRVVFAGSRMDVAPWLNQFDVFVLGSRREGISNTVLEAMAAGLPVVATDTGGNRELVVAGETGILVPPRNSEALAAAMQRYFEDRSRITEHGCVARTRAETQFSLETMTARYDATYRAIASGLGWETLAAQKEER